MCGFPGGLVVKNPPANAGDAGHGFDPWTGKIPWKRKWQPTPLFLPGKSHGQRSLVGYSPRGHKELTMTEPLSTQCMCRGRECMGNLPSQTSIFKKSLKRKGFLSVNMKRGSVSQQQFVILKCHRQAYHGGATNQHFSKYDSVSGACGMDVFGVFFVFILKQGMQIQIWLPQRFSSLFENP